MARRVKDPGFGLQSNRNAQRVIANGQSNIKHLNRERTFDDLYSYLINISWPLFLTYVVVGYVVLNLMFALVYYAIGVDQFQINGKSFLEDILSLFFFSAQTVTTVGYGAISPTGHWSGFISSFEALVGLLSFSFITGLLYGRFSKPKAKVKFSDNLIMRDFEDGKALMFRVMNKRMNMMIEPELNATISMTVQDERGAFNRQFFQLQLTRNKIMYLPTMWTLVHKIEDESPFLNMTEEEILKTEFEIYILFQYHEEAFNQKVYQIHSYDNTQLKVGYKFCMSYSFDEDGFTVMDHNKLNHLVKL